MKVLIVDDNKIRNEEIVNFLKDDVGINKEEIYKCYNTQDAKGLLRTIYFDYLILDVVLPKRDETPDAKYGLQLLDDIKKRPTIKKPQKIVGITSFVEDIEHFRQKFEEHCEVIIEASNRNNTWKSKIRASLNFEVSKQISKFTRENNLTCLTVHGIRTRGDWQQKLKRIVSSNVDTVSFETYKYGYFTVISFMIPF
ncbi:response regulator, partial [Vibrio cholerae]|nr:response regulator [Vibrio cholerae]